MRAHARRIEVPPRWASSVTESTLPKHTYSRPSLDLKGRTPSMGTTIGAPNARDGAAADQMHNCGSRLRDSWCARSPHASSHWRQHDWVPMASHAPSPWNPGVGADAMRATRCEDRPAWHERGDSTRTSTPPAMRGRKSRAQRLRGLRIRDRGDVQPVGLGAAKRKTSRQRSVRGWAASTRATWNKVL